jgi:hypothetical protein
MSATGRKGPEPGPGSQTGAGAGLEMLDQFLTSRGLTGEQLVNGFPAMLDGEEVKVTAVLERTAVYQPRSGDRRLVRQSRLHVRAEQVSVVPIVHRLCSTRNTRILRGGRKHAQQEDSLHGDATVG